MILRFLHYTRFIRRKVLPYILCPRLRAERWYEVPKGDPFAAEGGCVPRGETTHYILRVALLLHPLLSLTHWILRSLCSPTNPVCIVQNVFAVHRFAQGAKVKRFLRWTGLKAGGFLSLTAAYGHACGVRVQRIQKVHRVQRVAVSPSAISIKSALRDLHCVTMAPRHFERRYKPV